MTDFLSWGLPGFLTWDVSVSGIGIVMVPEPRDCEGSRAGDCEGLVSRVFEGSRNCNR